MLKELDHPKTVCLECAEDKIIQISENQVQIVKDYKTQICHSNCKMLQSQLYSGVPESVPQPALQKCKAMDENGRFCVKGKCFGKQHGWEKHQHIRYELIIVPKMIFNGIKDSGAIKEAQKHIESKIEELENEKEILIQTTLKFFAFLKLHYMGVINDAFEPYTRQLINEEQSITNPGNYEIISALTKMLGNFLQEKEDLMREIERGDISKVPNLEDIPPLINQIFQLPNFGSDIENFVAGLSRLEQNYSQMTIVRSHRRSKAHIFDRPSSGIFDRPLSGSGFP